MHIPDGYIGPQTYGAAYALMIPVWAVASKVLRKTMNRKQIPLIALGAAFSFVVMFLNVPVMGRMTAHPAGAGLVAIVCGPWAACIAISAALLVQAVPFGDGGITTFAANCLNLAVIAPFVSWGVFRLIAGTGNPLTPTLSRQGRGSHFPPWQGGTEGGGRRLSLASAVAGYAGIVAAAAAVGIEVGLQNSIAGPGMYLPYSIKPALAAMLIPHLLIIGPLEGVITAAATAYIYRTEPWVLSPAHPDRPLTLRRGSGWRVVWGSGWRRLRHSDTHSGHSECSEESGGAARSFAVAQDDGVGRSGWRANVDSGRQASNQQPATSNSHQPPAIVRRLLIAAAIIALLAPVGIILPGMFGAGAAWGEWGVDELKEMLGYVPSGILSGSDFWKAPMPDYALPGKEATLPWIILMAVAGGLATIAVGLGIGRLIVRGGKNAAS